MNATNGTNRKGGVSGVSGACFGINSHEGIPINREKKKNVETSATRATLMERIKARRNAPLEAAGPTSWESLPVIGQPAKSYAPQETAGQKKAPLLSPLPGECPLCGEDGFYWLNLGSAWVCGVCHPPAPPMARFLVRQGDTRWNE